MLNPSGLLLLSLSLLALVLGIWAVVDATTRPAATYYAAGKLTKPAWVAITAVSTLVLFARGPLDILGTIAMVAVIVYLVDVRPAVRQLKGGSSDGPYGPR